LKRRYNQVLAFFFFLQEQTRGYTLIAIMGKIDVTALRGHVEAALEDLLRAADEKVSWRVVNNSNLLSQGLVETVPTSAKATKGPFSYTFLPGVYSSHPSESEESTTVNDDGARTSLILHGDNTFEYHWSMKRNGSRPSEHYVEIHGEWKKPLLNRTRRGEEDQRLFLIGRKIKFQRNSHYGKCDDYFNPISFLYNILFISIIKIQIIKLGSYN
jgi:hypothetical protein